MVPNNQQNQRESDTEAILRLVHKRFGNLIRSLPNGIAIVDRNGIIEAVNPATLKLFDCSEQNIVKKNISLLLTNTPWNNNYSLMDWHVDNQGKSIELMGKSFSEERIPLELTINQMEADNQNRLLVVIQDITQRFIAEQFKQECFQMINHDIRAPLSSLLVFLEALEGRNNKYGTLNQTGRERTAMAKQNIANIIRLSSDLLELDKLESRQTSSNREAVVTTTLFTEALASIKELSLSKNIEINTSTDPIHFEADYSRLVQVLVNLLSNALDYSKQGDPAIELTAISDSYSLTISVRDHGTGIPDQEKKYIFDRFKRGSSSKRGKGFGLGLAICKEIIKQHNGSIGCSDAPGGGTVFWFKIPITAPDDNLYSAK